MLLNLIRKLSFTTIAQTREIMSKSALVFLAQGAEEMETIITVDTLRRAGIVVTLAGVDGPDAVLCSRDVRVVPDVALSSVSDKNFDAVIVPGGLKGAETCASVSFHIFRLL
jgi:protein DJ-1